jgi:galactose mutarotase-like enzyme
MQKGRKSALVSAGVNSRAQQPENDSAPEEVRRDCAINIGGAPVVVLKRPASDDRSKPHFTEATILPGRGMNLLQLKAYLPGKGEIDVIHSPTIEEAKQYLDVEDDEFGYNAFKIGGAVLVPWANRIRGILQPDGKSIKANVGGKTVTLPAGWHGNKPGAEIHAIHGLMLKSKFENVRQRRGTNESSVRGTLHAGSFAGHWCSQTDITVTTVLAKDAVEMVITAKNVGKENLPVGIGAHPYFEIPSGDRKQVRLHIPADKRAEVNNPDDVFPTGKLIAVEGTVYDFRAAEGKCLGDLFMDENFVALSRNAENVTTIEITDPAANYGVRIKSLSPEVKAFQVYARPDKNFVAVEPQFNLNDPFSRVWGNIDTGMVNLRPGQSVSWRACIELFTPQRSASGHTR